ncbi:hypothetical protein HanIR_Chr02g0057551 [Helianthus annuus]|nr:hypothetical protein HanIR_Chr02g0057551 [Helianthus annuus]
MSKTYSQLFSGEDVITKREACQHVCVVCERKGIKLTIFFSNDTRLMKLEFLANQNIVILYNPHLYIHNGGSFAFWTKNIRV